MLPAACGMRQASLSEALEARRLAAELQVQFTKMVDAGNRAVMVGDDKAAGDAAREAAEAAQQIEQKLDGLSALLGSLRYGDESSQLEAFREQFDEYRALDRDVLPVAAENTYVKPNACRSARRARPPNGSAPRSIASLPRSRRHRPSRGARARARRTRRCCR